MSSMDDEGGQHASAHSQGSARAALNGLGRNRRLRWAARQHPVDTLADGLERDPATEQRHALDFAMNGELDEVGVLAIVGLDDRDVAISRSNGSKLRVQHREDANR